MKTTCAMRVSAALSLALLLATGATAGEFAVPWHSIDGGGGAATGNGFRVTGTIGQPDAGRLTNAAYVVGGGFWPAEAGGGGHPTLVVLYNFVADVRDGAVRVRWSTASEVRTLGFRLYRWDTDQWILVTPNLIPAAGTSNGGMGASYAVADAGAAPGGTYRYRLVELETDGGQREYGPYDCLATELALHPPFLIADGGIVIRWLSRTNETYTVQRATNLVVGFEPLARAVPAGPPENVYTDRVEGVRAAFYRIMVEEP